MLRAILSCILIIFFSNSGKTADWPDSILHRPYAVQSLFLDTIRTKIESLPETDFSAAWTKLEDWAVDHSDKDLADLTRIAKYRMLILSDSFHTKMETDLQVYVSQFRNKKKYLETEALATLGLFYWRQQKYAVALEIFFNAYNLYSKFTPAEFPNRAEFQWQLGSCYYHFKDFKLANQYFLEIFHIIPTLQLTNPISKLNTIALCYRKLEMYDSSLYYFETGMKLAQQWQRKDWIGILNGNIADILYKQGRYDESIPMFEKDIEASLQGQDFPNAALSLSSLADLYRLKNEAAKGLPLIEQALGLIKNRNPEPLIKRVIYTDAARLYAAVGDKVKAYEMMDSAMNAITIDNKQSDVLLVSGIQHKVDVQSHMAELQTKNSQLGRQRVLRNSFIAGFALVLFFTFVALRQKKRLSKEKKRSDRLLLNILPAETAEELKETGKAAAKSFENVTILFTDFKDFTRISEKMSAEELVEVINHYYSHFDTIMAKHNVEKIKTIGDSYMCAGGLPIPSETHTRDVVAAAIEIMKFTENERKNGAGYKKLLELRIGIHTGPVIAGIVGINKFAYDIWGDAVNIAKRMESSSEPGHINISQTTYDRIKDQFNCLHRGEVDAKNKGMMDMYFVDWEKE